MKTIISLAVGLVIGWFLGYTRPATKEKTEVAKFLTTMEWDDSKAANFAVKAIPAVEAGDKQKAIELLALPIGSWYRVYAENTGTNEDRIRLKEKINQLASSNSIVASEIRKNAQ